MSAQDTQTSDATSQQDQSRIIRTARASHIKYTHHKTKSAMMTTNQKKLRQSCREYRAIKAGDSVPCLRRTRKRQMQRRNKINHATSAQHAPRISNSHNTKTKSAMVATNQTKLSQSCREYHAIKAGDLVAILRMTRKHQMQR